jgi:ribosomal protein L11 methyltransferase
VPACDSQLQELVLADLDDFQPTAIQEPDEPGLLRAFFATPQSRDAAARALAASFGSHLYVKSVNVDDGDWAARSQAQLSAITVGGITIAPPWDVKGGLFTVIVCPSMGFGTGHHATTRLVLKALQELPVEGRTLLDIGCGSGVLAIAAAKLGARASVGIDIDPDALSNAKENLELNSTDELGGRVRFEEGDFREIASPADIVLANLTGSLLERSAPTVAQLVEPNGHLIVSGFMDSEQTAVLTALEKLLTLKSTDHEEEWVAAVLQRPALADRRLSSQVAPDIAQDRYGGRASRVGP